MKYIEDALNRTDWVLLSKQKEELIRIINNRPAAELLEGLLNWIDAMQDAAALDGLPVVFIEDD